MLMTIFYLTFGGLLFYYVLLLIFPFLFKDSKTKAAVLIVAAAVVFGFLNFSYEFDLTGANYVSYVQPIEQNEIPHVNFSGSSSVLPGYFVVAYIFKNFLLLNPIFVLKFVRFLLFIFLLLGIKELAELLQRKYDLDYNFVFLAIFVFAFDWHTSFLLIGNSFRNALGQVFYIFFLLYLFRNQRLKSLLLGAAAILSHQIFLLAVPVSFLLWRGLRLVEKLPRSVIFFFLPLFSVASVLSLQLGAQHLNILGFGDKLSHPVSVGTAVFGAGVGVWLILVFHALILALLYKFFPVLKKKDVLFFSAVFLAVGLIASKVNILGIQFVEPTRFYFLVGPYLGLVGAYFLTQVGSENLMLPALALYAAYNLALINFSKQSAAPTMQLMGKSIFDFWGFYFNSDISQFLIGASYILAIILFAFIVRRRRVIRSLLTILNAIVFLGFYKLGAYIFPFSLLYLMFFSLWLCESKEASSVKNLLLNFALFLIWEIGYLVLNLPRAKLGLMSVMAGSLLVWAFLVFIWNYLSLTGYMVTFKKQPPAVTKA